MNSVLDKSYFYKINMAYIRLKKINNSSYAYLVESNNTKEGPRQKVKKYLGRVYQLEKKDNNIESTIDYSSKKKILQSLILNELSPLGFNKDKNQYKHQNIIFSTEDFTITNTKNKKEAILKLNEGYLSSFTLNRLFNFKKSSDLTADAHLLAKYFLEAGLIINEKNFVKFYQLL